MMDAPIPFDSEEELAHLEGYTRGVRFRVAEAAVPPPSWRESCKAAQSTTHDA